MKRDSNSKKIGGRRRQHDIETSTPSIQVLSKLSDRRKVWWDADITSFEGGKQAIVEGAVAALRYHSAHGYPSSHSKVSFVNDSYLRDLKDATATEMSWRTRRGTETITGSSVTSGRKKRSEDKMMRKELYYMRSRLIENSDKVSMLQKQLELTSPIVDGPFHQFNCSTAKMSNVFSFLRRRLALQIQKFPRSRYCGERTEGTGEVRYIEGKDGVARTCIRVNADCDPQVFEMIAQTIRNGRRPSEEEVMFSPPYEMTQPPPQGSLCFRILFQSFPSLCSVLGINYLADRLEMIRKYGTKRGEGAMRLLGTYVSHPEDRNKPELVFVARSWGQSTNEDREPTPPAGKRYAVLTRENTKWDIEDRRFEKELRLHRCALPPISEQDCSNMENLKTKFFNITWKRLPETSIRTWSRGIAASHITVGVLEVILPCIMVTGSVLCDEFTTLLTEEVLRDAVK